MVKTLAQVVVLATLLLTTVASADRVQVYSVQGIDCGDCSHAIKAGLKKVRGVKKADFDIHKVEVRVSMGDDVTDAAVLDAIARSGSGFRGVVGAGKGAYLPFGKYPAGADVAVLTETGAAVGALEKLCVAGKYTVFDLYADWCGPCRVVDAQLREVAGKRSDVAVRKLNVVDFKSPLAREMGSRLKALPYVVVFSPSGKRTDLTGVDAKRLAAALGG